MPTPLQRTQAVLFCADFKHEATDFCVDEELGFECSGSGEHVWVLIRKTGINTVDAAAFREAAAPVAEKLSAVVSPEFMKQVMENAK